MSEEKEVKFPGIALNDTVTNGEVTGRVIRIDRHSLLLATDEGEMSVPNRGITVTQRRV